jgi:putative Ig domain-containing protein
MMWRSALLFAIALLLLAAPPASAAVTVTRAELNGGQVRVEGGGAVPGATMTVSSPDSTATGRADSGGSFRVEASSFRSNTCRVTVTDGASSAEATLAGCTPSATPAPGPTPTPAGTCAIVPETFADGNVGTLSTWFFSTTGCRTSEKPVRFNVVSGRIPPGTTLFTQGVASGGITGRPTTEGFFAFTIEVQDQNGARDTESFSIRINPPRPLVITNQSDALSPGTVGQFYCCGNLFADGGVPGYTWSLRAGQLPPGLRLTESPGRITGTPTTRGTFSFLVRVTDSRAAFAERTFSITISG